MGERYAQMDFDVLDDPQVPALAEALGVVEDTALGLLGRLFILTGKQAPDGVWDVRHDLLEKLLARGGVTAPRGLIPSLIETDWLRVVDGGGLQVRGWGRHTGKGLSKRALWAKQKRAQRRKEDKKEMSTSTQVDMSTQRRAPERSQNRTVEGMSTQCPPTHERTSGGPSTPDWDLDRDKDRDRDLVRREAPATPMLTTKPKKSAKRRGPEDFNALLEEPYEGHPRALDFFKASFPAYDGKNGRLHLRTLLSRIKQHYVDAPPAKQWKTPEGIHVWLSKDYGAARYSWERDTKGTASGAYSDTLTLSEVLHGGA